MKFSNDPIDVIRVIQLLIPVVTFIIGYYLSVLSYNRDKKRTVMKEKFDKLYHPFYVMIVTKMQPHNLKYWENILMYLINNMYLASEKAQNCFSKTHEVFFNYAKSFDKNNYDKDEFQKVLEECRKLLVILITEYMQYAKKLGYEIPQNEEVVIEIDAPDTPPDEKLG